MGSLGFIVLTGSLRSRSRLRLPAAAPRRFSSRNMGSEWGVMMTGGRLVSAIESMCGADVFGSLDSGRSAPLSDDRGE